MIVDCDRNAAMMIELDSLKLIWEELKESLTVILQSIFAVSFSFSLKREIVFLSTSINDIVILMISYYLLKDSFNKWIINKSIEISVISVIRTLSNFWLWSFISILSIWSSLNLLLVPNSFSIHITDFLKFF